VSSWIPYNEFVDLVRNHHHNAYSGLITGISHDMHSFQIGFDQGEVVLMSYRIKKGVTALQHISQMKRAKITEHPNTDIPYIEGIVPDTDTIISQLTGSTLIDTSDIEMDDLTRMGLDDIAKTSLQVNQAAASVPSNSDILPTVIPVDARLKGIIEAAAVHHFGPIGAMVCEEHLQNQQDDIKIVIMEIARDVGASDADTSAFFQTVRNG
jgi:hypothetical protein